MPDYVTITEAAQILHCSNSTIRGRIRSGLLPAQRLNGGRKVLINRADLAQQLAPVTPTAVHPAPADRRRGVADTKGNDHARHV